MKKFIRFFVTILLAVLVVGSIGWYLFSYDRDFSRDMLLSQARFQDTHGNSQLSSWFYDLAYNFSGQDENVAIELANQYKEEGNYTKAEYTLTNALYDDPTAELYIALCRTYVEQDKLLDAVNLLQNISDPAMKSQLDALRPASPTTDYAPGFYAQYINVSLSSENSSLFFTTDGEYPTIARPAYSEPIPLGTGETTIYAIAIGENGLVSPLSILGYTVGGVIEPAIFTDVNMEAYIRSLLEMGEDQIIYTNDLWGITHFELPETVTDLEDLRLLPYLLSLTIQDHNLENLDGLTNLTRLEKLDLSGSRFPSGSLSVLTSLPTLKELVLKDCGLSSIADLEGVAGLTKLNLAENTLRNLEILSGFSTLQELDLKHNAVTDLAALAPLANLQKLDVANNSLTSLAPLSDCSQLSYLDASTNMISSISGLEQLSVLSYLNLNYNALADINGLGVCSELTELRLSNNALEDLSPLSSLVKLDLLDFSYNRVKTLPQWAEGCALRVIDGSYNALETIDNLAGLSQISYVYMKYNLITDINALANCYHLVQVDVYGNEVKDVDALTEHNIIVSYDPT